MLENAIKFTEKYFNGKVDVTDPCYNRDVWCRLNDVKIMQGLYSCYYTEKDCNDFGKRISELSIILEPYVSEVVGESYIGYIGVDSGLAGFFENKPDYNDDEWSDFCKSLKDNENVFENDYGFFSSSGFGDGVYDVYAYVISGGTAVGLTIKFIEEPQEDEEDY